MKKSEKLRIVRQHYPGAISTIDLVNKTIEFIEDELDIDTGKVMLADSWCSDDVNSIQYPARASEFLGPFKMGGLDGYPFVGATGMAAFANHVPKDGVALIYFGPHIGVSVEGTVGEIHRVGQNEKTGCCGAAGAGLNRLKTNKIISGHITDIDYQMNVLEQLLLPKKEQILTADFPIKEATNVIYDAIENRIKELVSLTTFNCKFILLVGVILINGDPEIGSFSDPKFVFLKNCETGEEIDLLALIQKGYHA